LLNPTSPFASDQENPLAVFYSLLATVIFLTVNGHHAVLRGLQATFDVVPLNAFTIEAGRAGVVATLTATMIVRAFQIAFPFTAALLVADMTSGLLARMVTEINVFCVNLSVKLFLGFLVMLTSMPNTIGYFGNEGVPSAIHNMRAVLA